jgi:hypothetical protein
VGQPLNSVALFSGMQPLDVIFAVLFFAIVIAISWFMPRRFGIPGMFAGHVLVVVALFIFTAISIALGSYEYEGGEAMIGLALLAFLLNCALLPVALFALWFR